LIHAVEVAIESIHVSGPEQAERSLPQRSSPWAAPWRARHRSTNLDRLRSLLALALSVHLHQYKPNFLVLH